MLLLAAVAAHVLFPLADPRIDESSGVAVATREPGVIFTHNDSGDSARFFAVGPDGRTEATYLVDGARNVDWEDMAAAPDARGVPTLWFADTGDNRADRPTVTVYAVTEPRVSAGTHHVRATAYRLRYPDGPHDAETLLVDPRTHRIYLATKDIGSSTVYAAPADLDASSVGSLTKVTTLTWHLSLGRGGPAGPASSLLATGGAWSAGGLVAIRTYTDAYLWRVGAGGLAAALKRPPTVLALPSQQQGEGVAFTRDGRSLVLTSEGEHASVYAVAVPEVAASSRSPSAGAASSAPAPSPTVSAAPATPGGGGHGAAVGAVAAACGVLLLIAVVVGSRRRRG